MSPHSALSTLRRWADDLRNAFWFVPIVCVTTAVGAAIGLIALDRSVQRDGTPTWIYGGGPANASDTLTTIASSMITFTGLVFSILMVALQLTSSQFSPRSLRNLLRDRPAKIALGVFVATFAYAFAALSAVRVAVEDDPGFVPGVTVTGALALVAASVVVFVRLIHHTAQGLRAVTIIEGIAAETRSSLDRLHPPGAPDPEPLPPLGGVVLDLGAPTAGTVTDVDLHALAAEACRHGVVAEVLRPVGDYVCQGEPILRFHRPRGAGAADDHAGPLGGDRWFDAIRQEPERTMRQDPAFGLRQLVDIAERALSPGVNDPTTAVQCLDRIHDLLRRMADRPVHERAVGIADGRVAAWLPQRGFGEMVAIGLDEVRHWGSGSLQIHRRMDDLLRDLLTVVRDPGRRAVLFEQQALLQARRGDLPDVERQGAGPPAPSASASPRE